MKPTAFLVIVIAALIFLIPTMKRTEMPQIQEENNEERTPLIFKGR